MTEHRATGETIIVHVPPGSTKNVKVVETEPGKTGQDITIQVSRERKIHVSKAVGVIVK